MTARNRTFVIIGVSDDGKPRAARMDAKDEAALRKAGAAMSMRVGLAKSDKVAALASKLPEAKIFESEKALVPVVKSQLYYQLVEQLVFDQDWTSIGVISGKVPSPGPELTKASDAVWSYVKPGSTVLVFYGEDPTDYCWSAAIVTGVSKDGLNLECRWRDWPDYKPFKVARKWVALLRPDICA